MKVPLTWLNDYVDLSDMDLEDLAKGHDHGRPGS